MTVGIAVTSGTVTVSQCHSVTSLSLPPVSSMWLAVVQSSQPRVTSHKQLTPVTVITDVLIIPMAPSPLSRRTVKQNSLGWQCFTGRIYPERNWKLRRTITLWDRREFVYTEQEQPGESVQMEVMMVIMSRPEMNGGRRFVPDDQSAQAQDNCSYYWPVTPDASLHWFPTDLSRDLN